MAQGTATRFDATPGYLRDKDIDIAGGTWKAALLTDPITSLLKSETNPALGSANCNEVSPGGGYVAGGIALTLDNSDSGGKVTMKLNTTTHTGGKITWTGAAGSPEDIKSMIVYDDAAASPVDAAIGFFDMTADGGTTPISMVAGDVTFTFGTGGVAGDIMTIN